MQGRELIESRQFLSRIQVWPKERNLDVEGWLENFDEGRDREVAQSLLDAFVHINDDHRKAALASTVHSVSSRFEFYHLANRAEAWQTFIDECIASIPLSHAGDGAASGFQYLRDARQIGFNRCLDTEHLVDELLRSAIPRPIIFFDDLAATGTQFIRNWKRVYNVSGGKSSLEKLSDRGLVKRAYFAPIVATSFAKTNIEEESPVIVHPTYLLGDEYSANSAATRLVSPDLRTELVTVAEKYHPHTGILDSGPLGYGDQGLAISFTDSTPNNALSVLRKGDASHDWKPLISNA